MKNLVKIVVALVIVGGLGYFFYTKSQDKDSVVQAVVKEKNPFSVSSYGYITKDELYTNTDSLSLAMISELRSRYEENFTKLIKSVNATGAKFVYCWFTTEVGDAETP